MDLKYVIIHELEKETGKVGAKLTVFDSTVDAKDERVINLITELNGRYIHRSETYGVFDKKNPTVFHTSFNDYFKKTTEDNFIDFSQKSSQDLRTRIDAIAPAKGGYLIFAHYQLNRNYVGVFLVRNTVGLSFTKNSSAKKFDINNVTHIDFENLAMACRINVDTYNKPDIRYLSFINRQNDDMAQFFTRWVSSTDTETNEAETLGFYSMLKGVDTPKDKETGRKMDRDAFLTGVYDHIQSIPGKLINIRQLSTVFYDDADYLNKYIEDNGISINGEFKAHPRALSRFIKIKAVADDIELSFKHEAYKKIIKINANNKDQIIIESKSLVEQIKEQMKNR